MVRSSFQYCTTWAIPVTAPPIENALCTALILRQIKKSKIEDSIFYEKCHCKQPPLKTFAFANIVFIALSIIFIQGRTQSIFNGGAVTGMAQAVQYWKGERTIWPTFWQTITVWPTKAAFLCFWFSWSNCENW